MYFYVNVFEVGVNDSIFSGNEQQKVYIVQCVSKKRLPYSFFINILYKLPFVQQVISKE